MGEFSLVWGRHGDQSPEVRQGEWWPKLASICWDKHPCCLGVNTLGDDSHSEDLTDSLEHESDQVSWAASYCSIRNRKLISSGKNRKVVFLLIFLKTRTDTCHVDFQLVN